MSIRSPLSFGVGEVLFSSEFRITPQEVAGWERAEVLGGRDDRPGFRPHFERPMVAGSPVPEGLVLARALDALEHSGELGGCVLERTSLGKLRVLGQVSLGERLTTAATIRYRSQRPGEDEHCFLTLAIEIRGHGRKLAEVELGVEVREPAPAPVLSFERRCWDQAA